MFFGRFGTEEDAIEWAYGKLSLRAAFCSYVIEEDIKLAIEILLTYLPDPQIGINYKGEFFLRKKYQTLCPSPAEAFALIQNQ